MRKASRVITYCMRKGLFGASFRIKSKSMFGAHFRTILLSGP
jgi:hypothetical protein